MGIAFLFACNDDEPEKPKSDPDFIVYSSAIRNNVLVDSFICAQKQDSGYKSIPLAWAYTPEDAKTLAITIHSSNNPANSTDVNCYLALWNINAKSVHGIPYGGANKGPFFIGPTVDGDTLGCTAPCSPASNSEKYFINVYALSETPSSLPKSSSLDVTYSVLMNALKTATVLDTATTYFTLP